jgi:hypothetical protein
LQANGGYELVRLDAGASYDKYVGESEKRLKKALDLRRNSRRWCCGSMRLRRRLRRPGRAEMRTRGYEEQRKQSKSIVSDALQVVGYDTACRAGK